MRAIYIYNVSVPAPLPPPIFVSQSISAGLDMGGICPGIEAGSPGTGYPPGNLGAGSIVLFATRCIRY